MVIFNGENNQSEMLEFIEKEDLINNALIENNHLRIGVFIGIYKKEKVMKFVDRLELTTEEDADLLTNSDNENGCKNQNHTHNLNHTNKDIITNTNTTNTDTVSNKNYFELEIDNWNERIANNKPIITSSIIGGYCWECLLYPKKK